MIIQVGFLPCTDFQKNFSVGGFSVLRPSQYRESAVRLWMDCNLCYFPVRGDSEAENSSLVVHYFR